MNKQVLKRSNLILLYLCFFAYAISYIGRLAYNTNIQNIITDYAVPKATAGIVSSAFFFCYGAGQIVNGLICGRFDSKKFVTVSLVVSSAISFSMFFVKNIYAMAVLWGFNGAFLSVLWTNLISISSTIKDREYLKKAPVILSVSLPLGTALAYLMSSVLTYLGIWKAYYLISGSLLLIGAVVFFLWLTKTQQTLAKLEISGEDERENAIERQSGKGTTGADGKQSLLAYFGAAMLPIFLILVVSSLIKDGVTTWMPSYLVENYDMPTNFSILVTLIIPLLGVFASILAKWLMKKTDCVFRATLVALLPVLVILPAILLWRVPLPAAILLLAALVTMMHVINTFYTAILPLDSKDSIDSGKAAGILNGFAYVGSVLSTTLLGGVVDGSGWQTFIAVLLAGSALAALCSILARMLFQHQRKS